MARTPTGARDEGLGNLEAFIALLSSTRQSLAGSQGLLDAGTDGLADLAASSSDRLQGFQESATGLAESLATTTQATVTELARLTHGASEVAEAMRGEALQSSQERFKAAVEASQVTLDRTASELVGHFTEVERAVDEAAEHTAGLVTEEEEGFGELTAAVAEADTFFTQADFDLHGMFESTVGYLLEGLEGYLATVFDAFFDHLEKEVQTYVREVLQNLAQASTRSLEDYDASTGEVNEELIGGTEPAMADCVDSLRSMEREQQGERSQVLEQARLTLEEADRNHSAMRSGSEIVSAYPPITPTLATAREVAERVQEMMDVFNPFG